MNLRREDVLCKDGGAFLRVRRKGGWQQMVPVGSHLTRMLLDVLKSLPEGAALAQPGRGAAEELRTSLGERPQAGGHLGPMDP